CGVCVVVVWGWVVELGVWVGVGVGVVGVGGFGWGGVFRGWCGFCEVCCCGVGGVFGVGGLFGVVCGWLGCVVFFWCWL
ncbi:hypothetical protein, partial [Pseudomonas syringae group genomosp. 7]|uniref:hypothetical protein n=1 Tax=Pseudomonas syringae group genomosp. 7 TaxID=251699 RepID=UPI00376F9495